jgi:hypothetical protein
MEATMMFHPDRLSRHDQARDSLKKQKTRPLAAADCES